MQVVARQDTAGFTDQGNKEPQRNSEKEASWE